MAGSLIAAIVAITRKAVKIGAKATSQFAKALAEIGENVGPFLGALFSMIGNIIALGAKGINWLYNVLLAKNKEFLKIRLGQTLGHAPYAPYDINDFECHIKVPKARRSKDPNLQRK